uniref:Odorant receptor n=1 Tax=Rhyacophila nubila TaxID=1876001 RepID=A0A3G2KX32_9NEOP|nr:odorant receptor OR7 [Rhyacophila nubila]
MWTDLPPTARRFLDKYYTNSHALMMFEIRALQWLGLRIPHKYKNHPLYSKLYKVYQYCVIFFMTSFLVSSVGDLYVIRKDIILVGEGLFVVVAIILILCKSLIFFTRFDDVVKMGEDMTVIFITTDAQHDRAKYRHIQDKYTLLESLISGWFHVLSYLLGMAFMFVRSSNNLPLRALYPFNISTTPGHEIAFIYQAIVIFYSLNMIAVMDGLACIYWHQISMHLLIISNELRDIEEYCKKRCDGRCDFKEKMHERLGLIIMRHQHILELSEQLAEWTSPALQAQVFASNFMICLTGFEVALTLGDWAVCSKFVMQMNSSLLQLLLWCFYGENVQTNSLKISDAVSEIPWYRVDGNFAKTIGLILARSQRPVIMKAGILYELNLETFLSVLSSAYSYFTVLNTLREEIY